MKINNNYYLDHQATCPLDTLVFEEMSRYMINSVGNSHSNEHAFGWDAEKAIASAKFNIAEMVGCDPDEIFFTSGATEANNLALKGFDYSDRAGLLHSSIEHKCVIETARYLQKSKNLNIQTVGVNKEGYINLDELEQLANENISVLSFIGVHNEIGTIQDFERIANICRQHNIKIHADMAQAPLAISLSNVIDHVDTLSLSAHKYYGPMGIGCLYIRRDIQHLYNPIIHGGGQQEGMRSGTIPVPLAVGMAVASKIIMENPNHSLALREKNKLLWQEIHRLIPNTKLNGPNLSERHPSNLNVSFLGYESADIIAAIQPTVAISSGSACTSGSIEPSYTLINIGLPNARVSSAVRISLGRHTTFSDIKIVAEDLKNIICKLPKVI